QNASAGNSGSETRLSLSNCLVVARAFWIELSKNSRARLQMVRCTLRGESIIRFPPTSAGRAFAVVAQNNVFSTGSLIVDDRNANRDTLTASMRWQGSENLFSLFSPGGRQIR